MKAILVLMLATMPIMAQTAAVFEKACGPEKAPFEVKLVKAQRPPKDPESGKALVFFIQDVGITRCVGCVTMRIGVDGTWVGALEYNSYFYVSVEPGEHRLCAFPQQGYLQKLIGLVHFTAEAGKTYYFRDRLFSQLDQALVDFQPIDRDMGEYFTATFQVSESHPKGRAGEK